MTTCILCLRQLQKGKSVKLSEPVCDTFTLGDAIRQQIQSNILLPYTQSSSQLTCKSCLSNFQSFFKFLRKVNLNLNSFKTENTFEISPDCHNVYVQPNVLMLKMEPCVLLPRIKNEPELGLNESGLVKVDVLDVNLQAGSGNFNENNDKFHNSSVKSFDNDRFSDDSDFAWSYDDPMDSLDDNEADNTELNSSKTKSTKKVQSKKTNSNQEGNLKENSEDVDSSWSNFRNIKDKSHRKSSISTNQLSNTSDIKIEHSEDELDNSEIKHENSDNSEDDQPLLNRKSTRSSLKSSKESSNLLESSKSNKKSSNSTEKSTKSTRKSPKSSNSTRRSKSNKQATSELETTTKISYIKATTSTNQPENVKNSIKSEKSSKNHQNSSEDSKPDIKPKVTDPNGPLPLFPAKTKTGYIRYLPRDQITQEMVDTGQLYVVIDGVEYRIPQKPGSGKPKKKKSAGFTRQEDASRRSHPAHDPEGQEKIKNFIDIKCYVCETEFDSFFKLKKHFRRFHPDHQVYLTCCNRKYRRRCDLLDHIEQHDNSAIHKCQICNKVYKTKGCLRTHMRFYHPKDDAEQVICYECGKMFNNPNLLKMHLMTHETDSKKTFECYICAKAFKNVYAIKRHLNKSHGLSPVRIICHICSASVREAYLSEHMKNVHSGNRTRVNCDRCGIWVLQTTYKAHLMKHTDMGVNCKVCGKFLKSTYSLSTHMKTVHTDNFKFKCEYCDKGFHRDVKMKEHIAVKHTRDFPFKCRIPGCGREFRAEGNWRIHEKKFHPEEYDKFYKPFYKRDNQEIQELEEMLEEQL